MVTDDQGQEATPPRHVGEMLRHRREELGYNLKELAEGLRIRATYLSAIEDGRWAELPGGAYVTGFLRSYAGALGLEPGMVLQRFKEDSAGIDHSAELYFPQPVDEGRLPGGVVLLVAGLLAVAAYGGWYFYSQGDRDLVQQVPELPARLADTLLGDKAPPTVAPEPSPVLQPGQVEQLVGQSQPTGPEVGAASPAPAPASPNTAPQAGPVAPATVAPTLPPPTGTPVPVPAAPATTAATPAGPPAATAAGKPVAAATPTKSPTASGTAAVEDPEDADVPQLPADLAPAMTVDSNGRPIPAAAAQASGAGRSADAGSAPTPVVEAPAPTATPVTAGPGRVFGLAEGPARVTVRATDDSWIEIRDARGTLWAARNLRPGDVFRAPDTEGLAISVVGNGAGIIISVDGRDLPPLGAKGQVVRDISLAPDNLKARTGGR